MTKTEHFDIALRLAGFNFKKEAVELIIQLYELTSTKEGEATLEDVIKIVEQNEAKWETKK